MTRVACDEWWARAREQWKADPPARQWRDVVAYREMDRDDRRRIERAIKKGLASTDPAVRQLAIRVAGDTVAAETPNGRALTEHLRLELHATHWRGRRAGAPVPLEPGAPVPGCSCERCTARPVALPSTETQRTDDYNAPLNLDAARAVPILDVAARLGLDVNHAGYALCPFHADSTPSLHLNDRKGRAFCNPCGRSWDGLALVAELRGLDFPAAVRWLLGLPEPEQRKAS
jgi:hypothetical protein